MFDDLPSLEHLFVTLSVARNVQYTAEGARVQFDLLHLDDRQGAQMKRWDLTVDEARLFLTAFGDGSFCVLFNQGRVDHMARLV